MLDLFLIFLQQLDFSCWPLQLHLLLLCDFNKSFISLFQPFYPPFGRNKQFFNKVYWPFHCLSVGLLLLQSLFELGSFQIDGGWIQTKLLHFFIIVLIFTTTYYALLRRAKQKIWRFCERKTKNLKGLRRKKNLPNLRCSTHRNLWHTTHRKFRINL